ncbi:uncharacterized protein LOC119461590 [Dermacentor silvarum]|uniref:uncharacterized protein LOC119461590 n=1 Tax=Dermacentor silvarum TaxID=543639 RepID=UPI00189BDE93|nr:uncharacterized protein LOC119461590 [Dermacentor silvarum]
MNRQGTKKKGCAATMNLKWIELYPEFQVDLPQPCGQTKEGRLKADKAKQLQEALDAEQQTVAKETRVYIRIADCGSHRNHGFDMPAYLHNRPHGFVDHMLRRLVNAEEYTHTDMRELPIEGMFSVHSERNDDDVHTVDFTKPSCTCPDFRKHKYPCKHFCVVFKYSDRWGFSSLPQSYLNRPQIALGSCLESETGSEIPLVNEPSPSEVSSQALGTAVSEPDIPFVNEPSFCQVPLQPVVAMVPRTAAPSVSELHKRITEELEKCSSLLYCCHDVQTLSEARGLLQVAFRKLAESVPQSSGLHIRGSPTKGCSSLKPLPKRRRI